MGAIAEKKSEQNKIHIPHIVIDDESAFFATSRIVSRVSIHSQGRTKEYIIERTKSGGYLMK